jgi:hypothetical protein
MPAASEWRAAGVVLRGAVGEGKMLRFRTAPEITSVLSDRPKADAEIVVSEITSVLM